MAGASEFLDIFDIKVMGDFNRYLGFLLIWSLYAFMAQGQAIVLDGRLVNDRTNEAVPFANVHIRETGIGTSTNLEGQFSLKLPPLLVENNYRLRISCIGYKSINVPLQELRTYADLEFRIVPTTTTLDELVIGGKKDKSNTKAALRIVSKAFQSIPRNYPNRPYKLETFYRHYCKEDDLYGRLIEAAVSLYDPKGYNRYFDLPPDKVELKVEQLRRSFDFTGEAKNYHTPIALNFIFSQEITSYLYKNHLKEDLGNFEFEITDTTSFEDQPVFIISFQQIKGFQRNETGFDGELFISANDFAFVRVKSKMESAKETPGDSSYLALDRIQNYRKFEDRYYANHLISDGLGEFARYDSLGTPLSTWNHSAHVEVLATNILVGKEHKFDGKEPTKTEMLHMVYDSAFWNNYNILKATPLEEEIEQDLAQRAPLDQQFRTYNLVHGGGKSILEDPQLRDLLAEYRGNVVYSIIWSSSSYPNFFELEPANYFKSRIIKGKVTYLFVSVDVDEQDWLATRQYQQLNLELATHRRIPLKLEEYISEQYYSNSFPMFLLIDQGGELISEDPLKPNDPLLKEQLRPLLKRNYQSEPSDDLISQF